MYNFKFSLGNNCNGPCISLWKMLCTSQDLHMTHCIWSALQDLHVTHCILFPNENEKFVLQSLIALCTGNLHLLSSAWYKRSKSSFVLGFILLSNSFFILSSFSFLFLISSCLSHSQPLYFVFLKFLYVTFCQPSSVVFLNYNDL